MVDLIFKAIPMAVMIGGGAKLLDQAPSLFNIVKKTVVQVEVDEVAKIIKADIITGTAPPTEENFKSFLQRNLMTMSDSKGRDTSLDHWGHPYRLVRKENLLLIKSNGEDEKPDTEDDIFSSVKF